MSVTVSVPALALVGKLLRRLVAVALVAVTAACSHPDVVIRSIAPSTTPGIVQGLNYLHFTDVGESPSKRQRRHSLHV